MSSRLAAWIALVTFPPAALVALLAAPEADARWEHHPSHFWLVLAAAALNGALALATGDAARRRGDARLWLISLAFLAAAGFLGLHALATPGVLLDGPNAGFVLATPAGLLLAALLSALAAIPPGGAAAVALMGRAPLMRGLLLAVVVAWGVVSLAELPPLDGRPVESGSTPLVVLAVVGGGLYLYAALHFGAHYRRGRSALVLSVVTALLLLGEAIVAVGVSRNWHLTWWEWHVLMLAAVALVAWAARRAGPGERFSDLYMAETAAGRREVSVLFADLQGFTAFSDGRDPQEVSAMLNTYFEVLIPPVVRRHGGDIDRLVGDALMATFNTRGDQPDHPARAAAAALALQREAARVAAEHPDWPRFRVGVNSGEAAVGVLGAGEGRSYTVIGDTVNLAARIESAAPVGGVAIGAATLRAVPGARVRSLGPVTLKGKARPAEVYVLEGIEREPSPPASE